MKLIVFVLILKLAAARNNVCKTFSSYSFKYISKDCYFDPNLFSNTKDIILRYNFPLEEHIVKTEDGYFLTVFRIPHSSNTTKIGSPVFLQHGAFGSSDVFVATKKHSLAYQLSVAGYDVWLGNTRGNFYSSKHQNLTTNKRAFWQYTLDDIANYDLPAVIDHIRLVTNKSEKISYIGHSQGTTTALMYSISKSIHAARNVKSLILLAPVAYLTDLHIPGVRIAFFIIDVIYRIGVTHAGSHLVLFTTFCTFNSVTLAICKFFVNVACGYSNRYLPEEIPFSISYIFNRESFQPVRQFIQIANSKEFKAFDYGRRKNLIKYGVSKPPLYSFKKVPVPVYLFGGSTDSFATVENVDRLERELSNRTAITKRFHLGDHSNFNHINFLYAKNLFDLIIKPIIDIVKSQQPSNLIA